MSSTEVQSPPVAKWSWRRNLRKVSQNSWEETSQNAMEWHRSNSLEGHTCDQRCNESSKVANGYKHQLPRWGEKYTPEDSLVEKHGHCMQGKRAHEPCCMAQGPSEKQNRWARVEPCFLTLLGFVAFCVCCCFLLFDLGPPCGSI